MRKVRTRSMRGIGCGSLLSVMSFGLMIIMGVGGGCSDSGGGSGGVASSPIRLNEVLFFAPTGTEWVELYNSGSDPTDMDLFEITNEKGDTYAIPAELPEVPPGGYVVILFDGLGAVQNDYGFDDGYAVLHSDTLSGDVFDNASDTCILYSGNYHSSSTKIDFVSWGDYAHDGHYVNNAEEYGGYGPVTANQSIGVHPDVYTTSIGVHWVIYAENETTQGVRNAIPAPVLVSPFPDSGIAVNTVSFAWSDWFINIKEFRLEMDDSDDFSSPMFSVSTNGSLYYYDTSLQDGRYYWRVKSITENSEESLWSQTSAFEIKTSMREDPWLTVDLALTPYLVQKKDTYLLCPGCAEKGDHAWDKPHTGPLQGIHSCPHCNVYCGRTSVAMVSGYFKGKVSRDGISYAVFSPLAVTAAGQLGHGQGLTGWKVSHALSYALKGNPWVVPEGITFSKVKDYILQGRPLVTATTKHVMVIDGFDDYENDSDDAIHLIDPWTKTESTVKFSTSKLVCIWAPPKNSEGIQEEDLDRDSDKDGIKDFDEKNRFFSDSGNPDTDGDGIPDKVEIWAWIYGKGVKLRRPFNGWKIWNNRNYDGDPYDDGDEDLNKNGNVDPGECDPFVAETPILISVKIGGADGGAPEVDINNKTVGRIKETGKAAGYLAREVPFLWCGTLESGTNSITIRSLASRDTYDDIQVRDIKIVDQNDSNKVLLNEAGPFHLGNDTLETIKKQYEEGSWYDPNPPAFWVELYGTQVKLNFSWEGYE